MNTIDFEPRHGAVIVTYDAGDKAGQDVAVMICHEMERSGIAARLRANRWQEPNWGSYIGAFGGGVISFVLGWLYGRHYS